MSVMTRTDEGAVANAAAPEPALSVAGLSRSFGAVKALADADLRIGKGEKLGLIGHNGAGKSTLINLLAGVLSPDEGEIVVGDQRFFELSARQVQALDIRCVFQELSLCPNLTAVENTLIRQPELSGWGWRRKARVVIRQSLDRIFPGHGIDIDRLVGNLTIAQRQIVEIALAFASSRGPARLVILDEPTSSLDAQAAEQLMAHLDVAAAAGTATVLVSHRLQEILTYTDRIVVMVDGRIVGDAASRDMTRASLVAMMGHLETAAESPEGRVAKSNAPILLQSSPISETGAIRRLRIVIRKGEIIGFAGLDGHGQRDTLRQIFAQSASGSHGLTKGAASYVPGDRQVEGVFPIWSVADNASIRALPDIASRGLIDLQRESRLAAQWIEKIGIRTAGPEALIGTLSGGNQQKVLFARALASKAELILLDDPMRGVDVGTKSEVYGLIRAEAEAGRSFVWYSTETEELRNCDRVYVFRTGQVTAELHAAEITEENILKASFEDITGEDIAAEERLDA